MGSLTLARAAFCGALVISGMAVYASTYDPSYHTGFAASDPNALLLPRVLLIFLIVLSGIAFYQDLTNNHEHRQDETSGTTVLVGGVMILATAVMPYTGFVLCVAPLVAIVTFALGERRWLPIVFTTLLAGVGFWFLFHHLLLIRLPSVVSGGAF